MNLRDTVADWILPGVAILGAVVIALYEFFHNKGALERAKTPDDQFAAIKDALLRIAFYMAALASYVGLDHLVSRVDDVDELRGEVAATRASASDASRASSETLAEVRRMGAASALTQLDPTTAVAQMADRITRAVSVDHVSLWPRSLGFRADEGTREMLETRLREFPRTTERRLLYLFNPDEPRRVERAQAFLSDTASRGRVHAYRCTPEVGRMDNFIVFDANHDDAEAYFWVYLGRVDHAVFVTRNPQMTTMLAALAHRLSEDCEEERSSHYSPDEDLIPPPAE